MRGEPPERLKSTVKTAPAIPTAELNHSILKEEDLWLAIIQQSARYQSLSRQARVFYYG